MKQKLKQEMSLDGANSQIFSNFLLAIKVGWKEVTSILKVEFCAEDTPKQLPIEPERTPAPSKSGDFQHFSSSKRLTISFILQIIVLIICVTYSM